MKSVLKSNICCKDCGYKLTITNHVDKCPVCELSVTDSFDYGNFNFDVWDKARKRAFKLGIEKPDEEQTLFENLSNGN